MIHHAYKRETLVCINKTAMIHHREYGFITFQFQVPVQFTKFHQKPKNKGHVPSIMGKSRRSDEVGPAEGRRVRKPGDAAATGKYLCRAR